MKNILVDAGPMIALFDNADQHHEEAIRLISNVDGRLLTTWPVLAEVCYMSGLTHKAVDLFLMWVGRGAVHVVDLSPMELEFIRKSMNQYADLPMDFADATILAIAHRERIHTVFSFDHHFDVYRLPDGRSLIRHG